MASPPIDVAERIRSKKARSMRFADTKQWSSFDTIFLPDATFRFVDAEGEIVTTPDGMQFSWDSLAAWAGVFEQALAGVQSTHIIGLGELELVGPDEVEAVFPMTIHSGPKEGGEGPHQIAGGYYYETWVRKGEDWFCKKMKCQRMYLKML